MINGICILFFSFLFGLSICFFPVILLIMLLLLFLLFSPIGYLYPLYQSILPALDVSACFSSHVDAASPLNTCILISTASSCLFSPHFPVPLSNRTHARSCCSFEVQPQSCSFAEIGHLKEEIELATGLCLLTPRLQVLLPAPLSWYLTAGGHKEM